MTHRIVLATDSLDPSGMGEHMLTLGAALQNEFEIVLAAPDGDTGTALLRRAAALGLGVKAIDLANPALFRSWLQNNRVSLAHIHAGIGWEGHGLVRAARGAGAFVVRTEHLPYLLTDVVQQAEYRAMLLSVHQRIAVSQTVAQSHAEHGRGPMRTIPNGIAPLPPQRGRSDVRAELGLAENDNLILTIARFTAQKGYDLLVDAAPKVLERHPKANFILVGTGPKRSEIEARITAAGLSKNMHLLGSRIDVPDLLASADLFVLPSYFEGLPLALLEAMAASLPIVASANGGTVEALGADHPYLTNPGEAEALAQKIAEALSNSSTATSIGAASNTRFKTMFSADRMAGQTAALYRSILASQFPQGFAA